MIINPQRAIEEGWVSGIRDPEKQVQPNAIDYTLDHVFEIKKDRFYISETYKEMRGSTRLSANPTYYEVDQRDHPEGVPAWVVEGHNMVDCLSDMFVKLPEGVAAILVPRSTFVRNGLFTQNGLYDSGFEGHIGTVLHNRHSEVAVIGVGTRMGQVMFVEAGTSGLYSGGYNHDKGTDLEYQA